jgi:drug/metabolite transporter (DMT)-like permease
MPLAVHLALLAVQILFSSLAITGKFVLGEVPPAVLVTARLTGAALLLVAVHRATGGPVVRDRRDLLGLFGLGFLGIVVNQLFFLLGLAHSTAINASVLIATAPVFTVLTAIVVRLERATVPKVLGIAIACAGSAWLVGPGRLALGADTAVGNILILLGMLAYAQYLVFGKRLVTRYDPMTVTTYAMAFAAIAMLPVGAPAIARLDLAAVRPVTWAWVAYIVVGPTFATYFLNIWALRRASSNVVAAYIYLQPVFTAIVAPLVLSGEQVTRQTLVGGVGIFAGLGLVIWGEWVQRRQIPAAPLPAE